MAPPATAGFATKATHGDSDYALGPEIAPNISLSTTFRHPNPDEIAAQKPGHYTSEWDPSEPSRDIYSRYTQPTLTRSEKLLSSLLGAPTLLYPSGVAAAYSIVLLVRPDVIAISDGYHGSYASFEVYRQTRGAENVKIIRLEDEYPKDAGKLLVWLETPLNPTGTLRSIEEYTRKAHAVGGIVAVDSTLAPPPIQDPFKWGADIVMHSATKYLGGHSDTLAGTVSVREKEQWHQLWTNRTYTGTNPGSMESWLIIRSLRTLPLRVTRQATTATALAQWLSTIARGSADSNGIVDEVWHGTLQEDAGSLIGEGKQMSLGSACFAFTTTKPIYAEWMGHVSQLFVPATSLGGVESLIEQRFISDPSADPRLLRLSIGLEDFEDLKADLIEAFAKVVEIENREGSNA